MQLTDCVSVFTATMSFNHGYPNPAERAALLSGLRGNYSATNAMRSASASAGMNQQSLDDLQYMMLQQQMQFQQPLPFNQQQQQRQQQQQQFHHNPAQAQLFAIQQSQLELQLQQIQMANLALQEQILMQHQQQARSHSPAHHHHQQQQQQQQQPQAPSYGNLAALGAAAATRRAGGRSVSAGPAYAYNQPAIDDASNNWRQAAPAYSSPDTSYEVHQTGNDSDAEARHEARRGALQNLQQARQQRSQSPNLSSTSGVFSPPTANLDWQAQRMQYKSSGTPEAAVVVTPPAQIDSGKRDLTHGSGQQQPQHRKNISEVSDASIQSLSISEAGSHVSPNRGPALVLSKPGDEFPEEEGGDESTDDGPMSPSLTASMRAASIHSTLDQGNSSQQSEKRRSSSGRHTVILRSSIVDLRRAAADNQSGRNSPFTDSDSSSAASSPTSDKSEVASFDSTSSTVATSLPNTSPTSVNFDTKDIAESEASLGLGKPPSASTSTQTLPSQRRAVSAMAGSGSLNASASVFAPGGSSKAYPSSLSVGSGSNTPLRLFSAPARNGTPPNVPTVLRQPKGPADEKDMAAKNFAGMIRRKAVGALRLAAASGARASPVSSPVLGGFPVNVSQGSDGMTRFASPSGGLTSPLATQTTFNMSDLATRAMRRRSQQGGYAGSYLENPGLGMTR